MIAKQYANTVTEVLMGDELTEQVCFKIKLKHRMFYITTVYGKIESRCSTEDLRHQYDVLEQLTTRAKLENAQHIIVGDLNAKIGHMIPHNDARVDRSGKLLMKLAKSNDLIIVNATEKCHGLWTRQNTQNEQERSVIDYVLCTTEAFKAVNSMTIDEEKLYQFSRYTDQTSNGTVQSDHYTITLDLNINAIPRQSRRETTLSVKSWDKYKRLSAEPIHRNSKMPEMT